MLIRLCTLLVLLVPLVPTAASAGYKMFDASWSVKAFGNELTSGTGHSGAYSAWVVPLGRQCNPNFPLCSISSTPTTSFMGENKGHPRGSNCDAVSYHPARGDTAWRTYTNEKGQRLRELLFPRWRNPKAFEPSGQPNHDVCTAKTAIGQKGSPITGYGWASTFGNGQVFNIPAASYYPSTGIRGRRSGQFNDTLPYIYSYTYATLSNSWGLFGKHWGPGSFEIQHTQAGATVASIMVKKGPNQFGGTMRMLGRMGARSCYYQVGGCSIASADWRYDAVGASAVTNGSGKVVAGYQATATAYYYQTQFLQTRSYRVIGSRFPWTTGEVTVDARGNGPHKTIHYTRGYDNRTANGYGNLQLVSPLLTQWIGPAENVTTGGIAILKLRFAPEPSGLALFAVGVGAIAVASRVRRD